MEALMITILILSATSFIMYMIHEFTEEEISCEFRERLGNESKIEV